MIKNKLKEIIDSRGMKQNWLADQVQVNKTTIGNIINNKYNTSLEVAFKIAKVLNIKVDDIFYLIEEDKVK